MAGLRMKPMTGVVTRKQTYPQKDTGIQKYLVEVAALGFTVPVFYESEALWRDAPPVETEVVLEGGFSPFKDGLFRLTDPVITPKKDFKPRQGEIPS